ncbi:hypothetical protein D3C76_967050 [compost metagenome]
MEAHCRGSHQRNWMGTAKLDPLVGEAAVCSVGGERPIRSAEFRRSGLRNGDFESPQDRGRLGRTLFCFQLFQRHRKATPACYATYFVRAIADNRNCRCRNSSRVSSWRQYVYRCYSQFWTLRCLLALYGSLREYSDKLQRVCRAFYPAHARIPLRRTFPAQGNAFLRISVLKRVSA